MSERFYTNWPLLPGPFTLDGPEARHLAGVCRLRPGDAVCLFNGDGYEYPARISAVERRQVHFEILDRIKAVRESPGPIEVAAPLPKGDRAQFLIEKLTEVGVHRYIPLETRRTVVHAREGKVDKLQRYVIEASKQSGRNLLMEVAAPQSWEKYCQGSHLPPQRYFGQPGACLALGSMACAGAAAWAVGPEGGFAEEEVEAANQAGWQGVNLGPRILRLETAAIVGAAALTLVRQATGNGLAQGG